VAPLIGILGGSFDPVHNGHVLLAIEALERLELDRLLVVPARQSPHKTANPSAKPEIRVEMLRLAFAGVPAVEISSIELDRPGPSYTVDTVLEVERLNPAAELVLIVGLDALADFPRWRDVPRIVASCRVAVFRRPGVGLDVLGETRRAVPGIRLEPLDTPAIEISSTAIRARAKAGRTLLGLVPDGVRELIETRKLYA
jgi:nicotinate-nucleotide adenylyltransferase